METARGETLEKKIPRGGEMVLVVDDEKDLLNLITPGLEQQGYKVLKATNGGEGLLVFDKYKQSIKLIVTDIVMPIMNGLELTDLLIPLYSQLKVLYMSGYPDNPSLQKRNLNPETNFIPKPFSLEDLAIRVRKILDN